MSELSRTPDTPSVEMESALDIALCALADIAFAKDLTIEQIRHKAARIYKELVDRAT